MILKIFKKAYLLFTLIILATTCLPAHSITVLDTYWGGTPIDSRDMSDRDIVGTPGGFDVTHMNINQNADTVTIDIYSRFLNNVQYYSYYPEYQLGDLFISTNGWTPDRTGDMFVNDDADSGEQWEYVLVLDNHGYYDPDSTHNKGGITSLYEVSKANIVLSDKYFDNGYRTNQEVQYDSVGQTAIASYDWLLDLGTDTTGSTDEEDFLSLTFQLSDLGVSSGETLGFHWVMTCGNDVIEGAFETTPVPEPTTMLLFGAGLATLTGISRRKKQ